jgi:hypothetical protein
MSDSPENQAPQVTPAQPSTPPPPYQPVAVPEPKKSSGVLKIVLIVVGVFVVLGIIGVGAIGYIGYRVAKSSNMSISSSPLTESELGVAIYPGAAQSSKGSMRMSIAGKSVVTGLFTTPASRDEVIAFYRDKLGPDAQSSESSRGQSFVVTKGGGDTLTVTIPDKSADGNTAFVIVHAYSAASQ